MPSVSEIVDRRRFALVSAFVQEPTILVRTDGPARLALLGQLEGSGLTGGEPQRLGKFNAERIVLVKSRLDPDCNSSVWVASGFKRYRGAYIRFLEKVYGMTATEDDLASYDIDHLLNRARSPKDSTLIRIEAVPAQANQAWGRLFEKAASDPRQNANRKGEARSMSYMICAKLRGEPPPLGPDDRAGIDRLVTFFDRIGITKAENTRQGIEAMLADAYKFRRK